MLSLRRLIANDAVSFVASLWPLTFLAPLVPGLSKASVSGLPWRQELVLALLLSAALFVLARRAFKTGGWRTALQRTEVFALVPLLLFVLWSAASLLWAESSSPALHHTFVWGTYLLFFLIMGRAASRPRVLRASMTTLAIVVCIISIATIVEFWGSTALLIRSSTGLGEPLAIAVPIFTVLALKLRRRRAALFCGATAVLAWLAMLESLERAPAIGASAALLFLACGSFIKREWRPRSIQRAVILFFFLAAATALQTIPSSATQDRPSPLTRLQTTSADDPNTRVRFLCWAVGLEMWRASPLTGVGANNFDTAFPAARARFSLKNSDSPLIPLNEDLLVERAHNEYVQILAELGAVGLALFLAFGTMLLIAAWRALRYARSPLALGCVCSLVAFTLSSGASSVSFRWMGSGLLFFFAAALTVHFASARPGTNKVHSFSPVFMRTATATALAFSLLMLLGRGAQATGSVLQSAAGSASTAARAEKLFSSALAWNPYDAPTHYNFGIWLFLERRPAEAVSHLRYAVSHGLNASVCYAYLAAAEAAAGDLQAGEQTLARAVDVYPRSVFLRVRHATALAEVGRKEAAEVEYRVGLALNPRIARGWRQLICFGRKAAKTVAFYDKGVAMPGELVPENCIYTVLDENERRKPVAVLEETTDLSAASLN